MLLSHPRLCEIAADLTQTIEGELRAYRPGESEPWLVIRAVDSSGFDVISDDPTLMRPHVAITAAGTTELVCPRRHPWGASVSINEVRGPEPHDGGVRLEIEMQSGDVLALAAQMITCARVD